MAEPIVASYVQQDDDWLITVSGQGRDLTGSAPGIIAARDRADQLVEKLGPSAKGATVVHLLNGSALEFTSVYMTARLTRPEPTPIEEPEPVQAEQPPDEPPPGKKPQTKSSRRPKTKITADIGDALDSPRKPAASRTSAGAAASGTVVAEAAAPGS